MKVPISWLRDYVDVDLTPEQLAERLTLLGMEVKGIELRGTEWRDVVVGQLISVEKHPNADRLSLTTVTLGNGEALEIVCGATNIAPGQRVPVALPGAVLPGSRRIERTEKMGVVSNGMLCSGDELRLTSDADGILILPGEAPLGTPIAELYGDVVLDVDVKPNRGDALSLIGLAREVAAATGGTIRWPETEPAESGTSIDERLTLEVREPELCTRFVGRWIGGVRVGPSPDSVQMRLLAAGLRPVSNVVDASNYVMLELGKPTHTFDAAAVAPDDQGRAQIIVRRAEPGERIETIDHASRELDQDTLVIADRNGPLGIAGIIGGATSEVGEGTTDVVVESAVFDPVTIRRTGQRYAVRSEAGMRFEKGQEVRLARIGADRCARLIADWAGGEVARGRVDSAPQEPRPSVVTFRPARINRLLGTDLPVDEQRELLARVGIETRPAEPGAVVPVALEPTPILVEPASGEAIAATVPTWRRDIVIEADVAEEVARVRGYERVPAILPHTSMPSHRHSPLELRDLIRETLAGAGLTESVTHALVSPRHVETFRLVEDVPSLDEADPASDPLAVTNPLSRDHSILRRNLVGSLIDVVSTNIRHGRSDVAIFEVGKGYAHSGAEVREWWRLGLALTGSAEPIAWNRVARPYDLDDAKGIVELLCSRLGITAPDYRPEAREPLFHPGRTARVTSFTPGQATEGRAIAIEGIIGEVHPAILDAWEVRAERVIVGEFAIGGLAGGTLRAVRTLPPPRFPPVERDLAVIVSEAVPAADVAAAIGDSGGELLQGTQLFDIYRGTPLADGEKSLAFRITFQASGRTLSEGDVEDAVARIIASLAARLGARLRS